MQVIGPEHNPSDVLPDQPRDGKLPDGRPWPPMPGPQPWRPLWRRLAAGMSEIDGDSKPSA